MRRYYVLKLTNLYSALSTIYRSEGLTMLNIPKKTISLQMKELISHYDYFLIDLWGVVHDGVNPYPGAVDCLNYLISLDKSIIFISNAPRPAAVLQEKLQSFGIQATQEMILSSGDVVRSKLISLEDVIYDSPHKRCYHLGSDKNQDILAGIPIKLVSEIQNADFILISAYIDEGEDLQQHNPLLKIASDLNIPAICANPDKIVMHSHKLRYCAGDIAEIYENMGGKVIYYGKPHPDIYTIALQRLEQDKRYSLQKVVAIGDTLETDILGAGTANIDSALVLTGNMGILLEKNAISDKAQGEFLTNFFKAGNAAPNWIVPSLSLLT